MKRTYIPAFESQKKQRKTSENEILFTQVQPSEDVQENPNLPLDFPIASGHELGKRLLDQTQNSKQKAVQHFLNHAAEIPDGYKGWSISAAAENGNMPLTTLLLNSVGSDVAPGFLKHAMKQALENGHNNIANMIEAKYIEMTKRPSLK